MMFLLANESLHLILLYLLSTINLVVHLQNTILHYDCPCIRIITFDSVKNAFKISCLESPKKFAMNPDFIRVVIFTNSYSLRISTMFKVHIWWPENAIEKKSSFWKQDAMTHKREKYIKILSCCEEATQKVLGLKLLLIPKKILMLSCMKEPSQPSTTGFWIWEFK